MFSIKKVKNLIHHLMSSPNAIERIKERVLRQLKAECVCCQIKKQKNGRSNIGHHNDLRSRRNEALP